MPEMKVKEEPEGPEPPSDPVEVPPGVVLDKLEALAKSGRALLRFQRPGAKGWGLNGKVGGEWCSFKVDPAGACEFVDDTVWATEGAGDWAESELEWLEKLRKQADAVPATPAQQPRALRPRLCRRAVFAYHKAEFAKQRQAKAKAKAAAGGAAASPPPASPPPASPAKAAAAEATTPPRPAVTKVASAPPAKPALSKVAASPAKQPATPASPVPAQAKLASAAKSPSPPASPAPAKAGAAGGGDFKGFLANVKARLTEAGQREKYREFLAVVGKGAQEQAITTALKGFDDLIAQFKLLPKPGAAKQPPQAAPPKAVQETAAAAPPATEEPPVEKPSALPRTLLAPVDVEKEVLAPLRECGGTAAVQLVKLVGEKRNVRASMRLAMLKYARSQCLEEGAFREMIILRGPPSVGKSTWVMEQLRLQVGLVEDEELVARLTHVCSADDFQTKFKMGDEEVFTPDPEQLEMAHARNEARARLAVEAGIHPLYIDNRHMQLWEMAPYIRLAQEKGYEISVVNPQEIFVEWNEIGPLAARNAGRPEGRAVPREHLEAALEAFEVLPEGEDAPALILKAQRPAPPASAAPAPVPGAKAPGPAAAKAPAAGKPAVGAPAAAKTVVAKQPLVKQPLAKQPLAKRPSPPGTPPPAKVMRVGAR